MDLKKYTNRAQEALIASQTLAVEFGHPEIDPLHILIALLQQSDGIVPQVVTKIGGRPTALLSELEQQLNDRPRVTGSNTNPVINRASQNVFNTAEKEAAKMRDEYVSTEHMLLALAKTDRMGEFLKRSGITEQAILKALADIRGSQRVTSQDPDGTFQSLENYGADLTAAAGEGKLPPVIGREDEVRRVTQVLRRRSKNHPVLIGEAGVGKTA